MRTLWKELIVITISVIIIGFAVIFAVDKFVALTGICDNTTFRCREQQFNICVDSEQFTRNECLQLIGNGKK